MEPDMTRTHIRTVALAFTGALAVGLSAGLAAQTQARQSAKTLAVPKQALDVKLGLWEVTSTNKMSGPMATASMNTGQTTVNRYCITEKDLESPLFAVEDKAPGDNCTEKVVTSTTSAQDSTLECTGQFPGTGTLHVERVTTESAKGAMTMKVGPTGQEMQMNSTFTAKWIGADCKK
jgi:Protein of unknown function (DUF3617)